MKSNNEISIFYNRMKKLGIELGFFANYPWVYLDEVNGKRIKEKYYSDHGFTAFMLNHKTGDFDITNISEIFKIIRKYV